MYQYRDLTPFQDKLDKMVLWSKRVMPTHAPNITTPDLGWIDKPKASRYGQYWEAFKRIELNHIFAYTHFDVMMIDTLPHEFVHHLAHIIFPQAKQSHGPEFRSICKMLGINEEAKTDAYKTGQRKHRRIGGTCDCGLVTEITFTIARRIEEGQVYTCKVCKTPIRMKLDLQS